MRAIVLRARTLVILAAIACSGGGTEPLSTPGIRFVAGAVGADTVNAILAQALTVEVADQAGARVRGVVVRFESVPTGPSSGSGSGTANGSEAYITPLAQQSRASFAADTTDAAGRAAVIVTLGTQAGPARVIVSVPTYAYVDTAVFTVRPGNAARMTLRVRDTAATVGGSYTIGVTVTDAYANPRPNDAVTYTSASSGVASVDGAGVVRALSFGRAKIGVQTGTLADSAMVSVVPDGTLAVVYYANGGRYISTVKLDGSGLTPLTAVASPTSFLLQPQWNAAGTRIAFFEGYTYSDARLYEVDLQKQRTPLAPVTDPLTQFSPRYSNDGQWVYFSGARTMNGLLSIWRVHGDGTGLELVTSSATVHQWQGSPSPDGMSIAFVSNDTLSTLLLSSHTITSLGVAGDVPEYSPDGTRIAFRTRNGQLGIMSATGGNLTLVAGTLYYDAYCAPSWSSDGKWIVIGGEAYRPDLVNVATLEVLPLTGLPSSITQPSFKP